MIEPKCFVADIIPQCMDILTPVFGADALLEVRDIISAICGISPLSISINPDAINLSVLDKTRILSACHRRAKREPLQYITGKAFFMHDEFLVGPGVLIPRNDTERLVEKALEVAKEKNKTRSKIRFLEFCTGSGCAGISLIKSVLKFGINIQGVATDISCDALAYASANAISLGVEECLTIVQHDIFSDDLDSLIQDNEKFDIIIANPPYIRTKEINSLSPEISEFEPVIALDGGSDGLKFFRVLAQSANYILAPEGIIITEIGYDQAAQVKEIFTSLDVFTKVKVYEDYSGNPRIIKAQKRI